MTAERASGGEVDTGQAESAAAPPLARPAVADMIATLDLAPHPEGGYFRETYRAETRVDTAQGQRPACTAILYLLTDANPSRFHRLRSDELWFHHAGSLAELALLRPLEGAEGRQVASDRLAEQRVIGAGSPYVLVPAGWWVAVRSIRGVQADWGTGRAPERRWTPDRRVSHDLSWTLVSCVVTPGFEYEDFEIADQEALLSDYPLARELILALT